MAKNDGRGLFDAPEKKTGSLLEKILVILAVLIGIFLVCVAFLFSIVPLVIAVVKGTVLVLCVIGGAIFLQCLWWGQNRSSK